MTTELISFAHQLADAAGAAIRPYFGVHGDVETKGDQSPVTIADRAAEQAMRALITLQFPDHAIFGEEFGQSVQSQSPYTWVIDPIDGTRAFIAGKKEWGTLIALCENGVPILGVLDQPITGERWVGVRGIPSETKTRNCPSLNGASISTTSRNYFTPSQAAAFVKLAEGCGEVIEKGDCYAYGMLARGKRDAVVDAGLKPYDILALVPIIEAAGGIITAWDGAPITLSHFSTALAAGDPARHAEMLAILREPV